MPRSMKMLAVLLRIRLVRLLALFVAVVLSLPASGPLFAFLFPDLQRPIYTRASFVALTLSHIALVAASSAVAVILGVLTGVLVTRRTGRDFLPTAEAVAAIGQTFPPVAVLAVSVPLIGYGSPPTLLALTAYGVLPILGNTIAALRSLPAPTLEAAAGIGFSPLGRLLSVELPLAAPVIVAGIRTSVIINIGTATIGSTVGALTLGSPIIEGLSGSNTAYVIQGAIVVGLLAIVTDAAFEELDRRLRPAGR